MSAGLGGCPSVGRTLTSVGVGLSTRVSKQLANVVTRGLVSPVVPARDSEPLVLEKPVVCVADD